MCDLDIRITGEDGEVFHLLIVLSTVYTGVIHSQAAIFPNRRSPIGLFLGVAGWHLWRRAGRGLLQ